MTSSGNLHPNGYASSDNFPTAYPPRHPFERHWQYVDEDPPNDDTDYVENDTTDYKEDLHECETFSLPEGMRIDNIVVYLRATSGITTATRGYAYIAIKTGGVVHYSSVIRPANDWTTYDKTWTLNPQTGLRWTQADIDALQIGVKGKAQNIAYPLDVSTLWFEVNYSAIPTPTGENLGDGLTFATT